MPRTPRRLATSAVLVALVALLAGCGGGDDESSDTSAAATSTPPTTSATTTQEPADDAEGSAEGAVVLEETFDDDGNRWTPESLDTETAQGTIADGTMTFSVSESPSAGAPEGQIALPTLIWPSVIEEQADELTDVHVETTVSFTEGSQVGLSCRIVDPTGDDFRSYDFAISSAGVAAIAEIAADGTRTPLARNPEAVEGAAPALPDEPAFDFDPTAAYELGATCVGGRDGEPAELTLTLDGEELLTAEDRDDPIPSGIASVQYGESTLLTELNGFTPFGVSFDDWTLTDLSGGGAG